MPKLSEVRYSREATVAAVSGYYEFLASMYLDESDIQRPPEGGGLGKTDEVIMLLCHLPYLRTTLDSGSKSVQAGPYACRFYSWIDFFRSLDRPGVDVEYELEEPKIMAEDSNIGPVPAHVVGLISTKEDLFMLDTELGVVYWLSCPGRIRWGPTLTRERILDDAYDYAAEEEADWRAEPVWAVADFFELLKDQFRRLWAIPMSPSVVYDFDMRLRDQVKDALPLVQAIYREHGWPDLGRYRKEKCLGAVEAALRERYGEDCRYLGLPHRAPERHHHGPLDVRDREVRERYFDDSPRPSGALDKAMVSYGSQLLETCKTSGTYSQPCAFPDKTRWCGVTTALPASLLPAYSAYASNASAWWSAHSSRAVEVAQMCPVLWYETGNFGVLGGAVWLNHTLINAECYAEAHLTAAGETGPTATPGQRVESEGSAPTSTPTPTPKQTDTASNGVAGHADGGQMWAVAASGLAAAWANVAL
ncbi:hypothetical protein C8A01DRAFT_31150 [Parachaetomium inaequale]|uniref:DUF7735 domain-containing protein n=1 Tax=Parachaetomium inaequale TaxID=2588326 RepID=A0AAN6PSS8_9PEZI|nr:hypothetical protein C8A01DRAFT_31150 [Parachaetomium inaequale]